ncbi:MAG: hypothetical protein U0800_10380 [Isosphaeraceae bacterium]
MLVGFTLLALLCADGHPDQDHEVASLVESLGSPRFAERQRATDTLLKMGDEARPALDAARSARDPEVRERAAWLVETIDGLGLARPSQVELDVRDRPMGEVAREIGRQAGFDLEIPANFPGLGELARKPVTLRIDSPVSFWTALERLREATGLPLTLEEQVARKEGRGRAGLRLERAPSLATDEDGPVRGEVIGFSRKGDLGYLAQVRLRAEPRLRLRVTGMPRGLEARDEFGHALASTPDPLRDPSEVSFAQADQDGGVTVWIPMDRPVDLGQSLKRLKFSIPIALATRREEPSATIPFGEAEGKAQVLEDIVVIARRPGAFGGLNGGMGLNGQVQLILRSLGPDRRADLCEDQLELRDAGGRVLSPSSGGMANPWRGGMMRGLGGQNITLRAYTLNGDDRSFPAELRYYELRQTELVANLEFRDIPLPR